ncbi:ATP-dependent protease LonB [Bacillus sp. AFS002410]|uniref:ATP-dependent protease LonB n=1 Tax=Bacillus sp. AFS002410 TaxID=2033481 RepID=UPI000BF12119|nr:ATP-dependent protease LonB [Bacillus sp. AFS002410]PEJ56608.1 ATP-dependent protease LonB [Bacillus sp. AFS002410]
MSFTTIILLAQLALGTIVALYFIHLLKGQRTTKVSIDRESKKEMEQLRKLKSISLTVPLAERVRPSSFDDIVGQEDGIKALKASLCSANPQHVIIYGPPGIGKTAAARLVLEEAKKSPNTPFKPDAVFIELDATTARFDERGIADPLIGSVHDPIYQGAGAMGQAGVPQPKKGAVTDAHGGILFIDEIGELHPIQMNKMLKVLEDRKVKFESAYYQEENPSIPAHIHEIFKHGLPADFRLVGATTRSPDEIPPAIRSRCLEIFFRELEQDEIQAVAKRSAEKIEISISEKALELVGTYAKNGREAINLIQLAGGMVLTSGRKELIEDDIQWVVSVSRLSPRLVNKIPEVPTVGLVNGLAVYGANIGALLPIEVSAMKAKEIGKGSITITGIVEEESLGNQSKSIRRKSMAKGSLENVTTILRKIGVPIDDYTIHINFPSGALIDGPSAGIAMVVGIFSAVNNVPVLNTIALTGEMSIQGDVKPVGGVPEKVKAAIKAGATKIIVPKENDQASLHQFKDVEILAVDRIEKVLHEVFKDNWKFDIPTQTKNDFQQLTLFEENQSQSM